MKKNLVILLLAMLNIQIAYAVHPKLLFYQSDVTNNAIWNNRTAHTSLNSFYENLKANALSNLTSTLNTRDKMHYAADMAFIATIDLNITAAQRTALKSKAIDSLVPFYNAGITGDDLTKASAIIHISLIYDMLYNDLTASQRYSTATQIKALADALISPYYSQDPATGQFVLNSGANLYGNNHLMNAASGIGFGIIAIKGDALSLSDIFEAAEAAPYLTAVNAWLDILDFNNFSQDGSGYEGVFFGAFGASPMVAYYEALRRDTPTNDRFVNSNIKLVPEWLAMELIPTKASQSTITESMFDFNNINAAWFSNYANPSQVPTTHGSLSNMASFFAVLGGIYNSYTGVPAGAATWIFNHHAAIIYSHIATSPFDNYFGTNSILALVKYINNAPTSLGDILSIRKFYAGRGLIVRDGFGDNGTLFSFEVNKHSNNETGKCVWRWDEDDNNSFTFFAYGQRWVIDNGKHSENSKFHNTILIDGNTKPYIDNNDLQVADWYDYQYYGELYYITSEITNAWLKKIIPAYDNNGTGGDRIFASDALYSGLPGRYPSFVKDRRHAQYVQKEGSIPPYVIIYDDIQQSTSITRNYTFTLNIDASKTVSYNSSQKKATVTNASSTNIMEVYYHSAASTDNFTTDSITPQTYPSHTRLFYTANTTLNPHFHVILIPSATASSPVSSQTFTQLGLPEKVAVSKFTVS